MSEILTLANFYLTTWEEYHTGVLFLGYFSGPVEGILIVVAIYLVTGFRGMWPFSCCFHSRKLMILIYRNVVLGDESVDLARPRNHLSVRLYSEFTA